MSFYRGKRVLVTGGAGFLGAYVVRELLETGAAVRIVSRNPMRSRQPDAEVLAADLRLPEGSTGAVRGIDYVFHLAAVGWGLGANTGQQPQLLTQNVLLNTNLLDAAHRAGVERFLYTSSASVYPGHLTRLVEAAPWDGPPHAAEEGFGWAKRVGEVQAQTYFRHYGMQVAIVRPTNPYGPGDNLDPATSHVVPALIHKAVTGQDPVVVWGSGKAVRTFVHARDVARGMLLALERHAVADPVNLASEESTSVGDLTRLILDIAGRPDAAIAYDASRPEGPVCRIASVSKAQATLGFQATIRLRQGLEETIDWFGRESGRQSRSGGRV